LYLIALKVADIYEFNRIKRINETNKDQRITRRMNEEGDGGYNYEIDRLRKIE